MCGIAGIFSYGNNAKAVDALELSEIRDAMQSRGPDGFGQWISSNSIIGFAHRRLAIIDLTKESDQPFHSNNDRYVVVFNGEIYNYLELRENLISQGIKFRSNSDTEVLIELYRKHGSGVCKLLQGMFAFAIWDKYESKLFLARDSFGIKPLYIFDDGLSFRFCSQIKPLVKQSHQSFQSDSAGLLGYWLWGNIPEPFTGYKNVESLAPGASLTIDISGKKAISKFCSLSDIFIEGATNDLQYENLESALSDSVRHHLIADVPVGVFLSAGIDSSVLTAMAASMSPNLKTVTLGFEEYARTDQDESLLAKKVADKFGTKHETIWIKKRDFELLHDEYFSSMDMPSSDGLNVWLISRAAKQAGLKVALSGIGGDEFFGGYPSFRQIPLLNKYMGIFGKSPSLSRLSRKIMAPLLERFTSVKYAGLLEYGSTWCDAYFLRRGFFMPWEVNKILELESALTPSLINEGFDRLQEAQEEQEKDLRELQRLNSPYLMVSYLEARNYMKNRLLRDADWASMANSLEIRVPFIDRNLVQYLAGYAASHRPYSKKDLAHAPSNKLPNSIIARPKTGFTVPVREWLIGSNFFHNKRGLTNWTIYSRQQYDRFK
jgi:asparagine synthase (glutamine-hydrolysing)